MAEIVVTFKKNRKKKKKTITARPKETIGEAVERQCPGADEKRVFLKQNLSARHGVSLGYFLNIFKALNTEPYLAVTDENGHEVDKMTVSPRGDLLVEFQVANPKHRFDMGIGIGDDHFIGDLNDIHAICADVSKNQEYFVDQWDSALSESIPKGWIMFSSDARLRTKNSAKKILVHVSHHSIWNHVHLYRPGVAEVAPGGAADIATNRL